MLLLCSLTISDWITNRWLILPLYSKQAVKGSLGPKGITIQWVQRIFRRRTYFVYSVRRCGERVTKYLGFLLFEVLLFGCYLVRRMVLFLNTELSRSTLETWCLLVQGFCLSGTLHVTDLLFVGFNMFNVIYFRQEFLKSAFPSKQQQQQQNNKKPKN